MRREREGMRLSESKRNELKMRKRETEQEREKERFGTFKKNRAIKRASARKQERDRMLVGRAGQREHG